MPPMMPVENSPQRALLFGATGMVGQGVLRESLRDPGIRQVVAVGRRPTGQQHDKLLDRVLADVADLSAIEEDLTDCDACFFCLGVSSAGMKEERYTALTYDLTLAIARKLVRINPNMAFVYVSGMGTDSSEEGRIMWARVKGRTENALLGLPFRAAFMFRPGIIIPLHGIRSGTRWTRVAYAVTRPVHPVLRWLFPNQVVTTEQVGRAMIAVARDGYPTPILETRDINQAAG